MWEKKKKETEMKGRRGQSETVLCDQISEGSVISPPLFKPTGCFHLYWVSVVKAGGHLESYTCVSAGASAFGFTEVSSQPCQHCHLTKDHWQEIRHSPQKRSFTWFGVTFTLMKNTGCFESLLINMIARWFFRTLV